MISIAVRPSAASQSLTVDLGGAAYRIRLDWNTRDVAWYASLYSVAGDPIVVGQAVRLGRPVFRQFSDPRLPRGELLAVDLDRTGVEPGLADLGARVPLVFAAIGEF